MGCHTRKSSLQLAMQRHCVTSCKENCLVWHGLLSSPCKLDDCRSSQVILIFGVVFSYQVGPCKTVTVLISSILIKKFVGKQVIDDADKVSLLKRVSFGNKTTMNWIERSVPHHRKSRDFGSASRLAITSPQKSSRIKNIYTVYVYMHFKLLVKLNSSDRTKYFFYNCQLSALEKGPVYHFTMKTNWKKPLNSMCTGTITAKQKVRQKVPGLYAVCR